MLPVAIEVPTTFTQDENQTNNQQSVCPAE